MKDPNIYTVDKASGATAAVPTKLRGDIERAWYLKTKLDAEKAELDQLNKKLLDSFGPGVSIVIEGVARATTATRQSVSIIDEAALRDQLQERFDDLVKTSVRYTAEPKLVELLTATEQPVDAPLAQATKVATSETISWRAEKPTKPEQKAKVA